MKNLMRFIYVVGIILCLTSCNITPKKEFELISYRGLFKNSTSNDTLIPYLNCHLYARISYDGQCLSSIVDQNNKRQYQGFVIAPDVIQEFQIALNQIKSDPVLVPKNRFSLYDGPSIAIFVHNQGETTTKISFDDSSRSNIIFRNFYKYIDSLSIGSASSNNIDSTMLIENQEKRLQSIFEANRKFFPVIIQDDEVAEE